MKTLFVCYFFECTLKDTLTAKHRAFTFRPEQVQYSKTKIFELHP